jgi:hypothetical protein
LNQTLFSFLILKVNQTLFPNMVSLICGIQLHGSHTTHMKVSILDIGEMSGMIQPLTENINFLMAS